MGKEFHVRPSAAIKSMYRGDGTAESGGSQATFAGTSMILYGTCNGRSSGSWRVPSDGVLAVNAKVTCRFNRQIVVHGNPTVKFYYTPHTCALASHIALEHAGADYEAIKVDFSKNAQRSPEYLRINPKGRVPALVTKQGVLTETPAILAFVAQGFPAAQLAPLDDPYAFAQVQSFNSYLCSTVHVAHAHRMRGHRWADDPIAIEAMKRKVPQSVGEGFALIESEMLQGPWVMGSSYTICDPYLFTIAQWLEIDGVDVNRLPRVLDHRRRMLEQPMVARTIAAELAAS